MNHSKGIFWTAVVAVALGAGGASADYETHPDLRPEVRCGGAPSPIDGRTAPAIPPSYIVDDPSHPWDGRIVFEQENGTYTDAQGRTPSETDDADPITQDDLKRDETGAIVVEDPGGVDSLHCQKLFWDLPTPTELGAIAIGAPFEEDTIPRWPNGLTDRLVSLHVENGEGYEQAVNPDTGAQRERLCPEGTVPWWAPVFDQDGDGYPDEGVREPIVRNFGDLEKVANALSNAGRPSYVFDPFGPLQAVGGTGPQEGEVFRLDCRRGVRTNYGPWQTGVHPNVYDKLFPGQATRFDTTPLLDADAKAGRICEGEGPDDVCICDASLNGGDANLDADPVRIPADSQLCDGEDGREVAATGRREWNTGSDFYNHFASHHGTCWNPETSLTSGALTPSYTCNDPEDPWTASDYGEGGECESYQRAANEPEEGGTCYAGDSDPDCSGSPDGQMFRNATQYPGRLYVEIPDNRGVVSLEKQIWRCDHHVVTQLPAGSYSMTKKANYRLQKGGVRNPRIEGVNCGKAENDDTTGFDESRSCYVRLNGETFEHAEPAQVDPSTGDIIPGGFIGGSAGEMVIQYFTDPFTDPNVKPVNVQFEVIQDAFTTWYPPFTFNAHNITWYAPFDMAIGLITTHSHHRNSLGYMDITPMNPIRPNSRDPQCGGSAEANPEHVFLNTDWEDAKLCEYWKEPDGPLVMRKGQAIKTTCYVNNGITPEAIKHGLLPGSLVEAFRAYNEAESGDPVIPEDPSTVQAWSEDPSSPAWGNIFADSPVGREFLYGTHPPINYRVAYKCGPMPGFTPILPFAGNAPVCDPNPAEDADGDYIDGAYVNEEQCGNDGGWCNPSTIIFANVGEDEMCIPVFMYWRLDQLVESDGSINQETQARLTEGAEHSFEEGDPQYFLDAVDQTGTPGVVQKWPGDIGDCRDCEAAGW